MSPPATEITSFTAGEQRDWSTLPPELLCGISVWVPEVGDYVRFRAVCKPWLSGASPTANLLRQTPWLLLPYDLDTTVRRFFSLSSRRTYTFDLPTFRARAICNSSGGWLFMVDPSLSFSLFNPLTRTHIHLPPISGLPSHLLAERDQFAFETFGRLDWKTQLLTSPAFIRSYPFMSGSGENIIGVVLAGSHFWYCKVQDKAWIKLSSLPGTFIETVTYHGGKFYIVYLNGEVAVCKLSPEAKPTLIPSLRQPPGYSSCCYLVGAAGTLMLISSSSDHRLHFYKLDARGPMKWSEIQDIGDQALFVTPINVIAAAVGEDSGYKRNYLYGCDAVRKISRVQQLSVISVDNGSFTRIPNFKVESRPDQLHSIWFSPSL